MAAKLERTDEALEVSLSGLKGSAFQDGLTKIKQVPGRRFNGDKKVWELPLEPGIAERVLRSLQADAEPDVLDWIRNSRIEREAELTSPIPKAKKLHLPWQDKLFGYQKDAISFLADNPKAILADDMGLGKTVQGMSTPIEWCHRTDGGMKLYEKQPKLVICPASVMGSWYDEVRDWVNEEAAIIDGSTPEAREKQLQSAIKDARWTVINWEKIRVKKVKVKTKTGREKEVEVMREPLLETAGWLSAIADEAHRSKNRKALTTKGLWRIKAPVQLALTGTPIMNSPDELWALLKWLYPKEYTSYWRFYNEYVDFYEGYFGRIITGVKNPDALRFELHGRLVRRTKHDALDLPPKMRRYIKLDMHSKQKKLYKEAEKEMWFEVEQAAEAGDWQAKKLLEAAITTPARIYDVPNGAARTVRLRQVAATPALLGGDDESVKLDTCVELIEDAGEKQMVVFSEFKGACHLLKERLAKRKIEAETLTGDDTPEERSELVRRFQAGEIQVLCCTIAAGGVGLTLTAADTCIFIDRHWTPAINEQAEDRLHRIGQDSKVTVIILQCKNTVDTGKIHPTNTLKEKIVGTVISKDAVEVID